MWHASKIGDKLQVAHILFYSQAPVIKGLIHHTRSDDRTAVKKDLEKEPQRTLKVQLDFS